MTRLERVAAALRHRETDIVPYTADFTQQEWDKMVEFTGDSEWLAKYGPHIAGKDYAGYPTELKDRPMHFRDDFGVVWDRSGADKDIGVVNEPIIPEPDIKLFHPFEPDEARLRRECEQYFASIDDRFTMAGVSFTLFERFWSYCGMENALVYMLTEPKFTHALLDKILEIDLKLVDIYCEYPFASIYFGDDWGQQKGLIMGKPLWTEFIRPRLAQLYARAKSKGKFVIQHSCGDIHELFPDLIDIGLDCYQTFQPEIYDIAAVKREYGSSLSFWGGISTQRLLPRASAKEVAEQTRRIMDIMRPNGGFIASPTHSVPGDVPPENVLAMLEVFKNQ